MTPLSGEMFLIMQLTAFKGEFSLFYFTVTRILDYKEYGKL